MTSGMASAFEAVVSDRDGILEELASAGRRPLGYFCTYTPLEILHAAGFTPIRIMGDAGPIEKAYTLTPDFICPFLRKAVEKGLNGGFRHLAGIVQGYTCDVTCGLINIWEENIGGDIFHLLPLPYLQGDGSKTYLRAGLLELIKRLEQAGGAFSEKRLAHSIALYEKVRRLLAELYALRYKGALPLSSAELLSVILAGSFTSPERYCTLLMDLKNSMPAHAPGRVGIPVLVSGSLIEDPRVLDLLEESGGAVVADDLCTGIRSFEPVEGSGNGPIEKLMDRMMNHFPCPSRSSAEERLPRVLHLMEISGARGVVFFFQKFCTPHLADYPFLKDELARLGIPCTMIELEEGAILEGQTMTRLQGFFEMLGG